MGKNFFGIFTCSVHTWRECDGRVEGVHGRRRHGQSETDAAADAHLMVSVMQSDAHTDAHAHVHGVRITLGQVGHYVGRIFNLDPFFSIFSIQFQLHTLIRFVLIVIELTMMCFFFFFKH